MPRLYGNRTLDGAPPAVFPPGFPPAGMPLPDPSGNPTGDWRAAATPTTVLFPPPLPLVVPQMGLLSVDEERVCGVICGAGGTGTGTGR